MKNSIFVLGILWTLMVACVPVMVVSSDVEADVNFNDYKTFGFYKFNVEDKDNIFLTEPDFTLLKNAITSEMEKRSFKFQENNPDLMINLGVVAQNKDQTRETDFRDGRMGYMGQRNYHWESEEVVVNKYAERNGEGGYCR
ncbi:MAG: DUF4136 domain-containing protein [Flammeovirgaceae bacterium]|nr:DUF4136 domain-containing protein [Flammeovirgaceae bacterium]